MTARILTLPVHSDDCQVCGGRNVVHVHPVRDRGGETFVSQVGRIAPCPFKTGAEHLIEMLPATVLPGGGVA